MVLGGEDKGCARRAEEGGVIDTVALDRAVRRFPQLLRLCRYYSCHSWSFLVGSDVTTIVAEYRRIVAKELP